MPTGPRTGVLIFDGDGEEGVRTLEERGYPKDAPRVRTGSGSLHVYLAYPRDANEEVGNSVKSAPGLDVRGNGGYVLLPPSRNADGPYRWEVEWEVGRDELTKPPDWFVTLIRQGGEAGGSKERFDTARALTGVPEGERDNVVWKLACKLLGADVPQDVAERLVCEAASNRDPPLEEEKALEKVSQAYETYEPDSSGTGSGGKPTHDELAYRFLEKHPATASARRNGSATGSGSGVPYQTLWWSAKSSKCSSRPSPRRFSPRRTSSRASPTSPASWWPSRTRSGTRTPSRWCARTTPSTSQATSSGPTIRTTTPRAGGALRLRPGGHGANLGTLPRGLRRRRDGPLPSGVRRVRSHHGRLARNSPLALRGPGGGRFTFIVGLEAMLGERTGTLGLGEVERSRFALADVPGKTLLTATEQPAGYMKASYILNALISGDKLEVEEKGEPAYDVYPKAKVLWAMNELPRIPSANDGLFRRVKVVEIEPIPKGERDPEIKERIKEEGAGILNWTLEGLAPLRKRGGLEVPSAVKGAIVRWRETNDVPAMFVAEECKINQEKSERSHALYTRYKLWCEENGHKPKSSTQIAEDWRRLGFERKRDKQGVFWTGVELCKSNIGTSLL